MPAERAYSDEEVDAAVAALSEPERLRAAQDLVAKVAPQLQTVLAAALHDGGWFGEAHDAKVLEAAGLPAVDERLTAVRTLVAEETRMGMLVGVTVGFQLAHDLQSTAGEE
ncbi:MAG: hypothetical protein U0R70_00680 [Solirubrobacteraceae bacterium]